MCSAVQPEGELVVLVAAKTYKSPVFESALITGAEVEVAVGTKTVSELHVPVEYVLLKYAMSYVVDFKATT
jgi:hypothetical protein